MDATTTSGTGGAGGGGGTASLPAGTGGSIENQAPDAPVLKAVVKMAGSLHVSWTNVTKDCDAIVVARKKNDGAYETAYTLVGIADSIHDMKATPPGTYCYKVRCKRGGVASVDSNEKCESP